LIGEAIRTYFKKPLFPGASLSGWGAVVADLCFPKLNKLIILSKHKSIGNKKPEPGFKKLDPRLSTGQQE